MQPSTKLQTTDRSSGRWLVNVRGFSHSALRFGPREGPDMKRLHSIDQPGENGIPVQSIAFKDSKLKLDIAAAPRNLRRRSLRRRQNHLRNLVSRQGPSLEFKRATTPVKTEHKPANLLTSTAHGRARSTSKHACTCESGNQGGQNFTRCRKGIGNA